jgi:hypothetical protein
MKTKTKKLWGLGMLLLLAAPSIFGADNDTPHRNRQDAEVTFTKWVTGVTAPTVPGTPLPPGDPGQNILLMAGFTGGAAPGLFSGEVLYRKVSANRQITQLWPIYQVSAGNRSFTALIQGGTNNATGVGLLEGVIMDGWRTGSHVRVRFQTMTNCAGAPAGTCFQGTIRILKHEDEDED